MIEDDVIDIICVQAVGPNGRRLILIAQSKPNISNDSNPFSLVLIVPKSIGTRVSMAFASRTKHFKSRKRRTF